MSEKAPEAPPEELAELPPEEIQAIYKSALRPDTPDWTDDTVN